MIQLSIAAIVFGAFLVFASGAGCAVSWKNMASQRGFVASIMVLGTGIVFLAASYRLIYHMKQQSKLVSPEALYANWPKEQPLPVLNGVLQTVHSQAKIGERRYAVVLSLQGGEPWLALVSNPLPENARRAKVFRGPTGHTWLLAELPKEEDGFLMRFLSIFGNEDET